MLSQRRYAARPLLARALCDYLIYTEHNMKKALELCALATQVAEYQVGASRRLSGGLGHVVLCLIWLELRLVNW